MGIGGRVGRTACLREGELLRVLISTENNGRALSLYFLEAPR